MNSPFEGGRNAKVFDAMLDLRFKEWVRIRKNMLARRRYKEKNWEHREEKRKKSLTFQ